MKFTAKRILNKKELLGGVAERLKAAVLKTVVLKGTVGSNPTSSASNNKSLG